MAEYWTTWGSVRGGCDHLHRSPEAAEACCARDDRGCRTQGGYSDRYVRVVTSRRDVESYDVTVGPGYPWVQFVDEMDVPEDGEGDQDYPA